MLRLRDESGWLIWLRFDEATNTIAMYNSATDKFDPAKTVGSNKVLIGLLANLYLKHHDGVCCRSRSADGRVDI